METTPRNHEDNQPPRRARDWYRFLTGSTDPEAFRMSYLGHYPSRSAFGEHLLEETYAASERLQKVPSTLRAYVRLDAEQVVSDWERAGHFLLCAVDEAQSDLGVYVFDAHGLGGLDRASP